MKKEEMLTISAQRLINPHSINCSAIEAVKDGQWNNAYSTFVERQFMGSWFATIYKKRPNNYHWTVFKCNCRGCDAELAVRF